MPRGDRGSATDGQAEKAAAPPFEVCTVRVLMLSWEYPPHVVGGLGKHVVELIPALADLGVEVHLVTPAWRGGAAREQAGEKFVVHRVGTPGDVDKYDFYANTKRANALLSKAAHEVIAREGPFDLIH